MNSDRHGFQERGGASVLANCAFLHPIWLLLSSFLILHSALPAYAATFTNNARILINDTTNGLSVNPANSQFSVSCWFRISVPSGVMLSDNIVILANRPSGTEADPHAYSIRFNPFSGNVEFTAKGSLGYTNTLVRSPYLDRWYHVAVTRQNDQYKGFADGRKVFDDTRSIGTVTAPNGVSIGGFGDAKWFFGDIQEVAIYNIAISEANVFDRMFQDQAARTGIRGYFKLGYSTNANDFYRNAYPFHTGCISLR